MMVCIQVLSEFLSVFYLVYVVVVPTTTTYFLLLKWKGIHFTLDGVFKKTSKQVCMHYKQTQMPGRKKSLDPKHKHSFLLLNEM